MSSSANVSGLKELLKKWPKLPWDDSPSHASAIKEWEQARLASILAAQEDPQGIRVKFIHNHAVVRNYP